MSVISRGWSAMRCSLDRAAFRLPLRAASFDAVDSTFPKKDLPRSGVARPRICGSGVRLCEAKLGSVPHPDFVVAVRAGAIRESHL